KPPPPMVTTKVTTTIGASSLDGAEATTKAPSTGGAETRQVPQPQHIKMAEVLARLMPVGVDPDEFLKRMTTQLLLGEKSPFTQQSPSSAPMQEQQQQQPPLTPGRPSYAEAAASDPGLASKERQRLDAAR